MICLRSGMRAYQRRAAQAILPIGSIYRAMGKAPRLLASSTSVAVPKVVIRRARTMALTLRTPTLSQGLNHRTDNTIQQKTLSHRKSSS